MIPAQPPYPLSSKSRVRCPYRSALVFFFFYLFGQTNPDEVKRLSLIFYPVDYRLLTYGKK